MTKEQAYEWYKAIQHGDGVDRDSFPEDQRGSIAQWKWNDPTFTYGIEYGALIAIRRIFGDPDPAPLNVSTEGASWAMEGAHG